MDQNRPTGHDVAREAGVSQATVSLVFSGKGEKRVSAATVARVTEAAERLGYAPMAAGRHLRVGRTGLVLLAVPSIHGPYFARVHAGAQAAATEHGLAVMVCSAWDASQLQAVTSTVQFDGIIICSPRDNQVGDVDAPWQVVVMDADPGLATPARAVIQLDVAKGMREACEHIRAGFGEAPVGHLAYARESYSFRSRQQAVRDSIVDRLVTEWLPAEPDSAQVTAGALRILDQDPRPRIIICDDDVAAAGVYRAAALRDLRIPTDLAVVGMDNNGLAELLTPALTTVDLLGDELGRAGVETIAKMLNSEPVRAKVVSPQLIARASTSN